MKITINEKNLIPNENWQYFTKVRAIIKNDKNEKKKCLRGLKFIDNTAK